MGGPGRKLGGDSQPCLPGSSTHKHQRRVLTAGAARRRRGTGHPPGPRRPTAGPAGRRRRGARQRWVSTWRGGFPSKRHASRHVHPHAHLRGGGHATRHVGQKQEESGRVGGVGRLAHKLGRHAGRRKRGEKRGRGRRMGSRVGGGSRAQRGRRAVPMSHWQCTEARGPSSGWVRLLRPQRPLPAHKHAPRARLLPQDLLPRDPAPRAHQVQPVRQRLAAQARVPLPAHARVWRHTRHLGRGERGSPTAAPARSRAAGSTGAGHAHHCAPRPT